MLTSLLYLVIYLIIVGLIIWLLLYIIDMVPLPAPFAQVAKALIMIIAVIIVILLLLQLVGGGVPHLRLSQWQSIADPARLAS